MWPRTNEEKARNRNAGFVCFINRADGEEAMETFNRTDPFCNGRRIVLRWGKNVKTTSKKATASNVDSSQLMQGNDITDDVVDKPIEFPSCNPELHEKTAVKVTLPNTVQRTQFTTTVAYYASKDGSIMEQQLMQRERNNPNFSFLFPNCCDKQERTFYKWRTHAFTQNDGYHYWRTEPFQMFFPNGVFWVPPNIIDQEKANFEKQQNTIRQEEKLNAYL